MSAFAVDNNYSVICPSPEKNTGGLGST